MRYPTTFDLIVIRAYQTDPHDPSAVGALQRDVADMLAVRLPEETRDLPGMPCRFAYLRLSGIVAIVENALEMATRKGLPSAYVTVIKTVCDAARAAYEVSFAGRLMTQAKVDASLPSPTWLDDKVDCGPSLTLDDLDSAEPSTESGTPEGKPDPQAEPPPTALPSDEQAAE